MNYTKNEIQSIVNCNKNKCSGCRAVNKCNADIGTTIENVSQDCLILLCENEQLRVQNGKTQKLVEVIKKVVVESKKVLLSGKNPTCLKCVKETIGFWEQILKEVDL